jgi:hypothetical protein
VIAREHDEQGLVVGEGVEGVGLAVGPGEFEGRCRIAGF